MVILFYKHNDKDDSDNGWMYTKFDVSLCRGGGGGLCVFVWCFLFVCCFLVYVCSSLWCSVFHLSARQ